MVVVGLPMFYLEMWLGQYCALSPVLAFARLSPLTRGLGWAMVIVSAMIAIYYSLILGWIIFYLGASCQVIS